MLYYDNAATTFPKPGNVLQSVISAMKDYGGNPGRGGHDMAMRVSEKIYSVRKKAADFFHSTAENVVFTSSCTTSLNTAIKGILRAGDHVIISCLEHNSVLRPVYRLFRDGKITYDIAQICEYDDEGTVAAFERLIRKNTRAIVCTHASNVSGLVMPLRALGELCEHYGLFFIADAAQTAGVLPINLESDKISILCMPGHKGLYGMTGSGLMILREGLSWGEMDTLTEGGTGSFSARLEQPDFTPDRFESGTVNTAAIFSIGAGIDFINQTGMERIYRHEFSICKQVYQAFHANPAIRLCCSDYLYGKNAPIVSFQVDGMNSEELTEELNRRGFALRGGLHCSPLAHEFYGTLETGMARFAPSAFTKEEGIAQFLRNMEIISKKLPVRLELREES